MPKLAAINKWSDGYDSFGNVFLLSGIFNVPQNVILNLMV